MLKVRDGQIVHLRDYVNVLAVAEATDRLPALLASISGQGPAPVPPDARS